MASTAVRTKERRTKLPDFCIKREADGRRQRSRKIIDEKRKKYWAKNESLWNASTDSKRETLVILKNYASTLFRKKRLSPTSKARREVSRYNFLGKAGCQKESKALEKSIVSRIVREPGLGLLNPSEMDREGNRI